MFAMAQAQHERPSSVDMGDGDCGLKEGSAASPRSAAVAKDVTDIVDIKTAKDIAVKRRQERRQLDVIDEDDALEGEPSSKRRPPPQLAIKRAASTPASPARTSPPLKKAAFTGGLLIIMVLSISIFLTSVSPTHQGKEYSMPILT